MSAPKSARTTSRKIAATRLNPLWVSRNIVKVHLLKKLDRFAVALHLQGQGQDARAQATSGGVIAETARGDVGGEQGVVRGHRRRRLRSGDAVVPVTAYRVARGRIADIGDGVLDDV